MIFHWYLFLLVIICGLLARFPQLNARIRINGRTETRYSWFLVLLVVIPMIVTAALRRSDFGDTAAYISWFKNSEPSFSAIYDLLAGTGKDKGFDVFTILVKMIIGNHYQLFFGIVAAICLFCVAFVYRRYSCNFAMSMLLFLASGEYIQWTHNGMRQFIAVCICFAATDLLLKKKYFPYILIVLVASTIHATALLMIPVCFIVQGRAWNLRSVFFTIAVLIAINFSGALSDIIVEFMMDTQYNNEVDQFLATEGTNILRVAVFSIPPLLALVFRRYLDASRQPILNLSSNMSIVSMGAYIVSAVTSGIFVGRIPVYFSIYNYLLLPWLVESAFDKRSQKIVYAIVIACYMYYYYYQVVVTWNL